MPIVGGKKFSYDRRGLAAAKREAQKTGQPLQMDPSYTDKRVKAPVMPDKRAGAPTQVQSRRRR